MAKRLTLITGGIRSGKSQYALELLRQRTPAPKCFLATAQALDEEMKVRIARHRQERGGDFFTFEEPLHLAEALERVQGQYDFILIDCLTLWVNNLLFYFSAPPEQIENEIRSFLDVVRLGRAEIVFVTNEVGCGVVGENPLNRLFIEKLGRLNQELARLCDEVILLVAGIPNPLKQGQHARLES